MTMRTARARRTIVAAVAAAVLATGLTACSGSGSEDSRPQAAGTAAGTGLKVADVGFGPMLTDANGRALYAFAQDRDATSTCTGTCIATWPALTAPAKGRTDTGPGVEASLLGTTDRSDGAAQVSYDKWPLYYYAEDTSPGAVNGQGVDGVWFAVSPSGKLIRTGAAEQADGWQNVDTQ